MHGLVVNVKRHFWLPGSQVSFGVLIDISQVTGLENHGFRLSDSAFAAAQPAADFYLS